MRWPALMEPSSASRPPAWYEAVPSLYLGVVTQPVRLPARQRGDLPDGRGLLVLDVSADSPAEAAGVLVGDIIVGAADAALSTPDDLLALLGPECIGQPLSLDLLRGASRESRPVVVGERITRR